MADGATVELNKVLLLGDDDKVTVGTPTVEGARVIATAQKEYKGKKVIVFRYKSKVRERRKTGHREIYTRLAIDKILRPGETLEEPAEKTRRRKKEVTESGA